MNGPVPVNPVVDDEEQSLAGQAYTQIDERIATLSLKPGQIVSENGLSKLLGLAVRRCAKRCSSSRAKVWW